MIARAEEEARIRLQELPLPVAQSFRGALTTNSMNQQVHQARVDNRMDRLEMKIDQICASNESASIKGKKRKAKEDHPESEGV